MKSMLKSFILILVALTVPNLAFSDTIYLRSGRVIQGSIIEKTQDYIRVDVQGVPLTYYRDDIERIKAETETELEETVSERKDIHAFSLGDHLIEGNTFEFKFPGEMDTLYLFNLSQWQGSRPDEAKLAVSLYDGAHNLLSQKESRCIPESSLSFGSMFFDEISKANVEEVKYFSLSVKDCLQEAAAKEAKFYPGKEGKLKEIYLNYLDAIEKKSKSDLENYMLSENIEEVKIMAEGNVDQFFMILAYMSPTNLKNTKESIATDEAFLSGTGFVEMLGKEADISITFCKIDDVWKIDEIQTSTHEHMH